MYGRTPGAGELRRLTIAERVFRAYYERQRAEDWVKWARENPQDAKLLAEAARAAGIANAE